MLNFPIFHVILNFEFNTKFYPSLLFYSPLSFFLLTAISGIRFPPCRLQFSVRAHPTFFPESSQARQRGHVSSGAQTHFSNCFRKHIHTAESSGSSSTYDNLYDVEHSTLLRARLGPPADSVDDRSSILSTTRLHVGLFSEL